MTSPDGGLTWSLNNLVHNQFWTTIAYGNGVFVSAAYNSYIINYSTDNGMTWQSYDMTDDMSGVIPLWITSVYDPINNNFILTSNTSSEIAIIKFLSLGAGVETVTYASLPATADWKGAAYGAGVLVAAAQNSQTCATSSDGLTWTQRSLAGQTSQWTVLEYINNEFVLIGNNQDNNGSLLLTSSNGVDWSVSSSLNSIPDINSIAYSPDNGRYVITTTDGKIYVSVDNRVSWSQTASGLGALIGIFKNGRFVIVIANSSYVAIGTTGSSWTFRTGYSYNWFDIA
jgi:hypothetical protein